MFVWSFRMSKREIIIFCVGLAVFAAILALFFFLPPSAASSSLLLDSGYSAAAGDADARREFLSQFGWKTEADPVAVREVIIPSAADESFSEYLALQHKQGFKPEALAGRRAKLWSYRITNYPGADGTVLANMLILDGTVIGGDISSAASGSFTLGFDPNLFAGETALIQQNRSIIDRSVPDSIPAHSELPPEDDGDESDA